MIDRESVKAFFDRLAPQWDADMIRDDAVIETILNNACVNAGADVLDVACGTGVLIPDYLARNVASVTAIDLSPNMARIARTKFGAQPNVTVLCGDAEQTDFNRRFDCIVIYNALPHFADPARLCAALSAYLKPGGVLTVAHGMSRECINRHHAGVPSPVYTDLPPAEELAALFPAHLAVTTVISDARIYQVAGRKA